MTGVLAAEFVADQLVRERADWSEERLRLAFGEPVPAFVTLPVKEDEAAPPAEHA